MARENIAARRAARDHYRKVAAEHEAGEGDRFDAVEASAKASGARNPAAVAAAIGRKKYGAKRFNAMARAGRK